LADCFQTRTLVSDLTKATADSGTAVLTGTATRLLTGLGGVGKTQLAAHLAERLWQDKHLDLLVWISAASRAAVVTGYAQAAVDIAVAGARGVDTERDAARFHAWLTTTDRRWLIVLDDLTSAADLKGLWPPSRPSGRTIITTRMRGAALTGADRHMIQVGTFTIAEATEYLDSRLSEHPDLADDVAGIAADLSYLPLALSQATAFMIDEEVPCSEYRRR